MSAKDAWAKWSSKYPLHEETLIATQDSIDQGYKPFDAISLEEAREQVVHLFKRLDEGEFQGTVSDLHVPPAEGRPGVPITVFKPSDCAPVPSILIFFHGGGLVAASSYMRNYVVKSIAMKSRSIVVNVEYRLLPCPEDPLAPFNDAVSVARWVLENREAVGGAAGSKVGVGGDSAGGQLACSVTHSIEGLDFQVLVYPVTDLTYDWPSFEEFRDIPAFNAKAMETMFNHYVPFISDAVNNPRVNPSAQQDLRSTPPTLVLLAELDPLRDEGAAYAQRLRDAGVRVEEVIYKGLPHGFFGRSYFKTTSQQAHEDVAKFIKSVM